VKRAYLTIDDAPSRDFSAKMEYLHRQERLNKTSASCAGMIIKTRIEITNPVELETL